MGKESGEDRTSDPPTPFFSKVMHLTIMGMTSMRQRNDIHPSISFFGLLNNNNKKKAQDFV